MIHNVLIITWKTMCSIDKHKEEKMINSAHVHVHTSKWTFLSLIFKKNDFNVNFQSVVLWKCMTNCWISKIWKSNRSNKTVAGVTQSSSTLLLMTREFTADNLCLRVLDLQNMKDILIPKSFQYRYYSVNFIYGSQSIKSCSTSDVW